MITWDLALAIAIVAVSLALLVTRYRTHWAWQVALGDCDDPERGSFADFVQQTPQLNDNDKTAEPAVFLVDRVSKLYDEVSDATKSQEAKATTILGFVGGGASLYALSTTTKAGAPGGATALIVVALAFFLLSLVACLRCLVAKLRRGLSEFGSEFSLPPVLNNQNTTKGRVAAYLFIIMTDRVNRLRYINIAKSYYIELAQQAFALGVLCIVVNYLLNAYVPPGAVAISAASPTPVAKPSPVPKATPLKLRCTGTAKTVAASKTLDCISK